MWARTSGKSREQSQTGDESPLPARGVLYFVLNGSPSLGTSSQARKSRPDLRDKVSDTRIIVYVTTQDNGDLPPDNLIPIGPI